MRDRSQLLCWIVWFYEHLLVQWPCLVFIFFLSRHPVCVQKSHINFTSPSQQLLKPTCLNKNFCGCCPIVWLVISWKWPWNLKERPLSLVYFRKRMQHSLLLPLWRRVAVSFVILIVLNIADTQHLWCMHKASWGPAPGHQWQRHEWLVIRLQPTSCWHDTVRGNSWAKSLKIVSKNRQFVTELSLVLKKCAGWLSWRKAKECVIKKKNWRNAVVAALACDIINTRVQSEDAVQCQMLLSSALKEPITLQRSTADEWTVFLVTAHDRFYFLNL